MLQINQYEGGNNMKEETKSLAHRFGNLLSGKFLLVLALLFSANTLISCSSSSSPPPPQPQPQPEPQETWRPGVFKPSSDFIASCETPRISNSEQSFPDQQGSELDEKNWLRSWSNETYLWYNEITDLDPEGYSVLEYFDFLKTEEITPTGKAKDEYHFTYDTEVWNQLSQSGISSGYGATWGIFFEPSPENSVGLKIIVSYTEPDSPATSASADLSRGARLLTVDGIDIETVDSQETYDNVLSKLFPGEIASYSFTVQDLGAEVSRTFTMESSTSVVSTPVQFVKTVATDSGNVGYLLFNDHIGTAEEQLISAIELFNEEGITDLVLDLRYNSGGYLAIASQLAYMIAGDTATEEKTFYLTTFNDKHSTTNPVTGQALTPTPFLSTSVGFSTTAGEALPKLDLDRVFVLTGPRTCSASETIINGLRGIDVEVIQIGATTCGKPFGFYASDNCGTSYFTVQFKGANQKGFGEYSDGFSPANAPAGEAGTPVPGCYIEDDFDHAFGDPEEARFAAALTWRETGECPPANTATSAKPETQLHKSGVSMQAAKEPYIWKHTGLQNTIMDR